MVELFFDVLRVPGLNCFVLAARKQHVLLPRVPVDCVHGLEVSCEILDLRELSNIPYLDIAAILGRCQQPAIVMRAKLDAFDAKFWIVGIFGAITKRITEVVLQFEYRLGVAGSRVVDYYLLVVAATREAGGVGRMPIQRTILVVLCVLHETLLIDIVELHAVF